MVSITPLELPMVLVRTRRSQFERISLNRLASTRRGVAV